VLILACTFAGRAQRTIVDDLQRPVAGEGTVTVEAEKAVNDLIGIPALVGENTETEAKIDGFRIMVYIGNDPKKSKSEAAYRQAQIQEKFPEINAYIRYEAPNWKVVAGDFLSRENAESEMRNIRKQFPEFGREMYILQDKINFPY